MVAALAFAFGGAASARLQHIGQVISLAYLPLTLWLLARALERSSWRAGLAAGAIAGLMAIGRDQVALLSLYVLAGYVLAHWLTGEGVVDRMRASLKPLAAAAVSGALVAAVPVIMTALLAARSNRPEISFARPPPARSIRCICCSSSSPICSARWTRTIEYWAPQSPIWDAAWGWPDSISRRTCRWSMPARCRSWPSSSFGLIRGLAWAREIRFFTIAAALMLLYALGAYTPAFHLMYELPFVSLYRRPADATFVLCALLAILAGYLVHRWLSGTVPAATRIAAGDRDRLRGRADRDRAARSLARWSGSGRRSSRCVTALVFTAAAIAMLVLARRARCARAGRSP